MSDQKNVIVASARRAGKNLKQAKLLTSEIEALKDGEVMEIAINGRRFYIKAARNESEDTQRSEVSQPEQTLGERHCPDEYTRYHPMVNKVADAIQTAGGDEVAMAQAAIRVCRAEGQPVLPGELVEAVRAFIKVIRAAGLLNLSSGVQLGQVSWLVKATEGLDHLEATLSSLPDPLPTVESVERAYLERLIAEAEGERPPKVFWGDGYDSTGRRVDIPLAEWLRYHKEGDA